MTPHREDTTTIAAAVQRGVQQLRENHAVERQRFTELQETLQRVALVLRLPPTNIVPQNDRGHELTQIPCGVEFHLCVTGSVFLHHMLDTSRYHTLGLVWWDADGWHSGRLSGDCDTVIGHLLGTVQGAEAVEKARRRLEYDVETAILARDRRLKRSRRFGAAAVIIGALTAVLGIVTTVEVVVALLVVCALLAVLSAIFHEEATYPNTVVERYSKPL